MEEETSSSWIGEEQTAGNSWTMILDSRSAEFWCHIPLLFLVKKNGHKHRGCRGFIPNIEDQFLLKFGANKSWGCCKKYAKVGCIFFWHLTSLCVDLSWALLFITHLPFMAIQPNPPNVPPRNKALIRAY